MKTLLTMLIIVPLGMLSFGTSSAQGQEEKIKQLVSQLVAGDRTVVAQLEQQGSKIFGPLKDAYKNTESVIERIRIIDALWNNPNPDTIDFFAEIRFGDLPFPEDGRYLVLVQGYHEAKLGVDFSSRKEFDAWANRNKRWLKWSTKRMNFFIPH